MRQSPAGLITTLIPDQRLHPFHYFAKMHSIHTIEQELEKCPELRIEDVKALRDWARLQPHFPNIDTIPDTFLAMLLRRRYHSLERAKETLDNYLTYRTFVKDVCTDRITRSPRNHQVLQTCQLAVLEERSPEGHVIVIVNVNDPDPRNHDFRAFFTVSSMLVDGWFRENGSVSGSTIIFDQSVFSVGHMVRVPLTLLKQSSYWNKHCAYASVKNIYVINATNTVNKILKLFQPMLDGNLFEKIRVFTSSQMKELYKHIPRECLPADYGGNAASMKDFHEKTIELLQRNEDFYQTLDSLKVDETKRRGQHKNIDAMFGLEGSFRQLNVD